MKLALSSFLLVIAILVLCACQRERYQAGNVDPSKTDSSEYKFTPSAQ